MRFDLALASLLLASGASAATLKVQVGADGNLAYSPNSQSANVGDIIEFHYNPKNHSVVQSSFAAPCVPLKNGFFSGFQPVTTGEGPNVFRVTVNDTKPIWFYCSQTAKSHCQSGMVGAINAPATGNTFDAFRILASKTNVSVTPPTVEGGVLAANADFVNTTTNASTTTSSAASSSTQATTTLTTLTAATGSATTSATSPAFTAGAASLLRSVKLAELVGLMSIVGGVALFI